MKPSDAKIETKVLYRDTENDRILKGTISSKLILSQYGLCVRLDLDEPGEGHTVALIENLHATGKELADDVTQRRTNMNEDKVQKTNDFKPDDIVYHYEHWRDSIIKCQVLKIMEHNIVKCERLESVNCNGEKIATDFGYDTLSGNKFFATALDAYNDYWIAFSSRVRKLCGEIKTIEDLIVFPTKYSITTDELFESCNVAFMAYKIRAKELANVDIEDQYSQPKYKTIPPEYELPV